MIRCKSPKRIQIREKMLDELKAHMKSKNTPEAVYKTITIHLNAWFDDTNEEIEVDPNISQALHMAIVEQNEIVWYHFLFGRLSRRWGEFINLSQWTKKPVANRTDKQKGDNMKISSEIWGSKIVSIMWKHI